MPRPRSLLLLGACALLLGSGCKKEPTCRPEAIEWSVQLALGASQTINPADDGSALPTSVRLIQLRGDLAADDLDFRALWESEKASDLGESYLGYEELIVYPGQPHLRTLPLEEDATHIVAAGLFREPVGTTWYTVYEIPKRHGDVVCAKAPESKRYPDPCFFVYLDRATMAGGETPPPGLVPDSSLECAPLGVVIEEDGDKRKGRRRRKNDIDPRRPAAQQGHRGGDEQGARSEGARSEDPGSEGARSEGARPEDAVQAERSQGAGQAGPPRRAARTVSRMRPVSIHVAHRQTGEAMAHEFRNSPIRLGRNPLNDLALPYPFVSGWHAVIRFDDREARFFDLGSTNGTLIDGRPVAVGETVDFDGPVTLQLGELDLTLARSDRPSGVQSSTPRTPNRRGRQGSSDAGVIDTDGPVRGTSGTISGSIGDASAGTLDPSQTAHVPMQRIHEAMADLRPAHEQLRQARLGFEQRLRARVDELPAHLRQTAEQFMRREFEVDQAGRPPGAHPRRRRRERCGRGRGAAARGDATGDRRSSSSGSRRACARY